MLLKEYAFIADENIPTQVVSFIRNLGIDVMDIKEQGLASSPDASIIELAVDTERLSLPRTVTLVPCSLKVKLGLPVLFTSVRATFVQRI